MDHLVQGSISRTVGSLAVSMLAAHVAVLLGFTQIRCDDKYTLIDSHVILPV
jgi:hypothetical protein